MSMLHHTDFQTETGKRLAETLTSMLEQRKTELESDSLDAIKTANVRGRIAQIKELQALATAPVREPGHDQPIGARRSKMAQETPWSEQ